MVKVQAVFARTPCIGKVKLVRWTRCPDMVQSQAWTPWQLIFALCQEKNVFVLDELSTDMQLPASISKCSGRSQTARKIEIVGSGEAFLYLYLLLMISIRFLWSPAGIRQLFFVFLFKKPPVPSVCKPCEQILIQAHRFKKKTTYWPQLGSVRFRETLDKHVFLIRTSLFYCSVKHHGITCILALHGAFYLPYQAARRNRWDCCRHIKEQKSNRTNGRRKKDKASSFSSFTPSRVWEISSLILLPRKPQDTSLCVLSHSCTVGYSYGALNKVCCCCFLTF